jgi:hypothetical protein
MIEAPGTARVAAVRTLLERPPPHGTSEPSAPAQVLQVVYPDGMDVGAVLAGKYAGVAGYSKSDDDD